MKGLGAVLECSWIGFRVSWGRLRAYWRRLREAVGRGFDALEPPRETLGSGLGSLTDFEMSLYGF